MTARTWPECKHCDERHPVGDILPTLLETYARRIESGEPIPAGDLESLVTIARCINSQLYAVHADNHNLGLKVLELRAALRKARELPQGSVTDTRTEWAVRRRDGDTTKFPAPDRAVSWLDNMDAQARTLGYESAEAEVVRRTVSTYAAPWTAIPASEIDQHRPEPPH